MKKNSGEKNEREEEFPNGRENEKKERGKKKKTQQGLMKSSVLNTHHSKGWGKKMFVMGICFYTFYRSRERERTYTRG